MDRFGMYNESICSATYRTQPSVHSAWIFQPTRRVRTRITFIPPKPTPALSTATCCNIGVTCNNYQAVCSRSSWARIRLRSKYACPSAVMDWWAAISLSPVRKTLVRYSSWISRFAGGALWRMYRSSRPYISALTFLARRCMDWTNMAGSALALRMVARTAVLSQSSDGQCVRRRYNAFARGRYLLKCIAADTLI